MKKSDNTFGKLIHETQQGKLVECLGTMTKGKSVLFKWNNKRKSSTPKKLQLLYHSNNLIETIIKR